MRIVSTSLILFFTTLLIFSGCSPHAKSKSDATSDLSFNAKNRNLEMSSVTLANTTEFSPIDDEVSSADFFQFTEALVKIGNLVDSPKLKQKSQDFIDLFYNIPNTAITHPFEQSEYVRMAIKSVKPTAMSALSDLQVQLKADVITAQDYLNNYHYNWPTQAGTVDDTLAHLQDYFSKISADIPNTKISPSVKTELQNQLSDQALKSIPQVRAIGARMTAEKDLSLIFSDLKEIINKLSFKLSSSDQDLLNTGVWIGEHLKSADDAQDMLTLIIKIWNLLGEDDRKLYFEPINAKLYKFLENRNNFELNCLASSFCWDPEMAIAKHFKIFGAIKDYGIDNLKGKISNAAINYSQNKIAQIFYKAAIGINSTILAKLKTTIDDLVKKLANLQNNFDSEVVRVAKEWSQRNFNFSSGTVKGAEIPSFHLRYNPKQYFVIQPSPSNAKSSSAEAMGAAMAALSSQWNLSGTISQDQRIHTIKSIIEQINKLLVIYNNQNISKSLVAVGAENASLVGNADDALLTDTEFRVSAQAELLRGISRLMYFFRDWQFNVYDLTIGTITLADMDLNLPKKSLTQKIFPKDTMYALSLGAVQNVLQVLSTSGSPVFLKTLDDKIVWADSFNFSHDVALKAGIVNSRSGLRDNTVYADDVAKFVVGVSEFLSATDGIEKTKSSQLLTAGSDGARVLDKILSARSKLKLLMVAMSNFLSTEFVDTNNDAHRSYDLKSKATSQELADFDTQILVAYALQKSGVYLKMDVYKSNSLDILYRTNAQSFNRSMGFYSNPRSESDAKSDISKLKLSLLQTVRTLGYLTDLQSEITDPIMKSQMTNLVKAWAARVEDQVDFSLAVMY